MRSPTRPRTAGIAPAVLVGCLLVAGLTGCTTSGSKAGPDRPATVLRLATPEQRGAPYTEDVERFAMLAHELTDGGVRIAIDYEVVDWTQLSEQKIVRMTQEGRTDLALVSPRVFDTVGIDGFRALQTPILIDTPELAASVAHDEVAADMLQGLSEHGLIGLGLVYEGLRRTLALNGAVTRAGDFEGLLVRVPTSNTSDRIFEALGAIPDHGDDRAVASTGERYALVETGFVLAAADYPAGTTVTSNLVLFPKYGALIANPDAFEELTEEQQDALRRAAAETVGAAAETTADEQDLARRYCEIAGDLAEAPPSEIEAIEDRLQPVVDELREDPAAASAIDAILELRAATKAPAFTAPPACAPPSGDSLRLPSAPAAPTP